MLYDIQGKYIWIKDGEKLRGEKNVIKGLLENTFYKSALEKLEFRPTSCKFSMINIHVCVSTFLWTNTQSPLNGYSAVTISVVLLLACLLPLTLLGYCSWVL